MAFTGLNDRGGNSSIAMFADGPPQQEPIRVCLRLRPVNKFELSRRSTNCVTARTIGENGSKIVSYAAIVEKGPDMCGNGGNAIKIDSPLEGEFNYVFDKVFPEESTQLAVYQHVVAPLASHALEGFNCALIAYGQTGSGKTHTMMGGCENAGTKHHKSSTKTTSANSYDEKSGMIHRLIKDVFLLIHQSPPTVEYIVRCSFVEIYLEKVLDLLNPINRTIQILFGEQNTANGGSYNEGVILHGASEACCFDEYDVISLLVRGNACRSVSSTQMNTDSSRSHAIFIMKIEQKDNTTGISKVSQLQMIDMAGSELGGKDQVVGGTKGAAIYQEARMINKSLSLLNTVVKTVVENQNLDRGKDVVGGFEVPYRQSKLTHLLRDAFGGNCRTSVILTASPASYNISESIRTMKFGHFCRSVKNFVKPSVEMSPVDYRKILNDSQKKQGDLVDLVNELSAECFQLKQDAKKQIFVESHYDGPLWKTIETILVNGVTPVVKSTGSNDSGDVAGLEEELSRTRRELQNLRQARENLEDLLAERQSEVAVLRTQNDNYASEKKKDSQELVALRNEIRLLTQRKQEVEHNLRTSQFREYEATVFLRQFRRFYRRLLRNKAHQGTGRTSEVIERVPGVPDLNDLIDVDSLLLEAGLIEESELHDDTATGAYRPSAQALGRSTDATNKAWKEAAVHGKVDELESFDRSSLEGQRLVGSHNVDAAVGGADEGAGASAAPHGQSISNRQQFLGTPAGRLTTMRERELERDLLRATERCIELQVALNEEKANVDILTNRAGNLNKKKFAQESIQLKQQLDKKTHDLQAIIWKMNELHLINKTYNEKMSNREQHVTYLEENLVELQSSNRSMILERQEAEGQLREELDNLKVLVDAMTVPLWQFGECGVTGRTLASRIRLPVCGGDCNRNEKGEDDDGVESMESLEESVVFYDEEEYDEDESEYENELDAPEALAPQVQIIAQSNVQMRDASTQTFTSSGEKGTMTDLTVTPQPPPFNSKDINAHRNDVSNVSLVPSPQGVDLSVISTQTKDQAKVNQNSVAPPTAIDGISAAGKKMAHINVHVSNNGCHLSEDCLFHGGKPAGSQPRRFVHKFGLMIRPGVLKESSSKAKSERVSRSVKI
mmetsp:Transcript_13077/g.23661  ORF Transcript_13077/g.23661 Transcript_13077/m.23661 type:complete len:1127 (-) Transcript_13077:160-3540(-)|eukprot:CAMPEP_0202023300 /NCGR_PEP_ID=MMETSP0905-20130828/51573_1 /ASSEMBLY_ACC=CAM_ASM_000554 /TAXON_ID=420261 /ORGANISM="Thalassiosira antarctica, Strain CCMP982" /LENGTH=1126 /DNA_ID=CAMNT_0048585655 /DNA_START=35 /DNA_END=3415 /DNA_ORIENTATION=+